jgi:hypothetical protein
LMGNLQGAARDWVASLGSDWVQLWAFV